MPDKKLKDEMLQGLKMLIRVTKMVISRRTVPGHSHTPHSLGKLGCHTGVGTPQCPYSHTPRSLGTDTQSSSVSGTAFTTEEARQEELGKKEGINPGLGPSRPGQREIRLALCDGTFVKSSISEEI